MAPAKPIAGVIIGCNGSTVSVAFAALALLALVGRGTMLVADNGATVMLEVDCGTEEGEPVIEELADPDAVDVGADPDPLSVVEAVSLLEGTSLLVIEASARCWIRDDATMAPWSKATP